MRDKATAEADALKIGILGGSYDPPHFGHLAIAKAALRELRLDEVLFLPNNRNPFKPVERAAGAEHRMAMVKLLIADEGSMAVSDIEITRGGISYTVDTLAELQMAQPAHYWFILGSDALKSFDTWKSPTRILKMCRLAVINREPSRSFSLPQGFPEGYRDSVDLVPMETVAASSTEIRERLYAHRDVSKLLPASILSYIRASHLYEL